MLGGEIIDRDTLHTCSYYFYLETIDGLQCTAAHSAIQ